MKSDSMKEKQFLRDYIALTPLALAFERAQECFLYPTNKFISPVMDFGCGDGIFSSILFDKKIFCGIDLNYSELFSSKQIGAHKTLLNASGYALPIKSQSFNTIISNSVLEHIPSINIVLDELNRVMSPGALLYITVPSDQFDRASFTSRLLNFLGLKKLSSHYRELYNRFWKHYHYYPDKKWEEVFNNSGFFVKHTLQYESRNMATMNDILVLFSFFSFLVKRALNRFVLFPNFRRHFFAPLFSELESKMKDPDRSGNGVLLFYILQKGV